MSILSLSCSNKPVEKEMKMPMLFDTQEQAEKEAYKFGCEGAHQMGDKWMPCSMHKHNHPLERSKFTFILDNFQSAKSLDKVWIKNYDSLRSP